MKRVAVLAAAVLCAAAPASIGLIGNASFSEDVPVRVPERAVVLDVHGATPAAARTRTAEPGDDRGGRRRHERATPAATPTVRVSDDPGDGRRGADDPATHAVGDDSGNDSGRRSGRDGGSHSGSDDRSGASGSGSSGSGSSGSGSSDSGRSGSGRSGHDD